MEKNIFFAVHFRKVTKENGKNIAFYVNIIEKSKQEILFYHFPGASTIPKLFVWEK
jgi:hypothetical protein